MLHNTNSVMSATIVNLIEAALNSVLDGISVITGLPDVLGTGLTPSVRHIIYTTDGFVVGFTRTARDEQMLTLTNRAGNSDDTIWQLNDPSEPTPRTVGIANKSIIEKCTGGLVDLPYPFYHLEHLVLGLQQYDMEQVEDEKVESLHDILERKHDDLATDVRKYTTMLLEHLKTLGVYDSSTTVVDVSGNPYLPTRPACTLILDGDETIRVRISSCLLKPRHLVLSPLTSPSIDIHELLNIIPKGNPLRETLTKLSQDAVLAVNYYHKNLRDVEHLNSLKRA